MINDNDDLEWRIDIKNQIDNISKNWRIYNETHLLHNLSDTEKKRFKNKLLKNKIRRYKIALTLSLTGLIIALLYIVITLTELFL